ncbi:hypothetical protein HanPI659440_Chr00c02g0708601 [Helianthus annuus]|nr:hypothetical protein HanPI659440_Chr00c02g0708601 [Helianthus annuus]
MIFNKIFNDSVIDLLFPVKWKNSVRKGMLEKKMCHTFYSYIAFCAHLAFEVMGYYRK